MKEVPMTIRSSLTIAALMTAACGDYPFDVAAPRVQPTLSAVPAATTTASILVDASKDGGVWWFPQGGASYDPALPHQGKALADYLRSEGFLVTEVPRFQQMTCEELSASDLVVVLQFDSYAPAELAAYDRFVRRGGRLMLLQEVWGFGNLATSSFGLQSSGPLYGTVTTFAIHPVTAGVTSLPFLWGLGVTVAPTGFSTLATLSGLPVMGIFPLGLGMVFFIGESNGIETVPQPFVDNLFRYMLAGAGPIPSCPVTSPADLATYLAGPFRTVSTSA